MMSAASVSGPCVSVVFGMFSASTCIQRTGLYSAHRLNGSASFLRPDRRLFRNPVFVGLLWQFHIPIAVSRFFLFRFCRRHVGMFPLTFTLLELAGSLL